MAGELAEDGRDVAGVVGHQLADVSLDVGRYATLDGGDELLHRGWPHEAMTTQHTVTQPVTTLDGGDELLHRGRPAEAMATQHTVTQPVTTLDGGDELLHRRWPAEAMATQHSHTASDDFGWRR